jgi:hypothetical protein
LSPVDLESELDGEYDEIDIFAEDITDDDSILTMPPICANDGHEPLAYHVNLPFIGTSSYDDHSWDAADIDSVSTSSLEHEFEVFDIEDTIQSILNINRYRERGRMGFTDTFNILV